MSDPIGNEGWSDERSFVDIVANTLGIVVLLSLFSVAFHVVDRAADAPRERDRQEGPLQYHYPLRERFPAYSAYYVISADHLLEVGVNEAARRLAADGTAPVLLEDGSYHLRDRLFTHPERGTVEADMDLYRLEYRPDFAAISQRGTAVAAGEEGTAIAALHEQHPHQTLTFVVYPSGMELFARLFPLLAEAGLPMRWKPFSPEEAVTFERHPRDFLDYHYKR